MSKNYYGSINYTELVEMLRTGKYKTFKSDKTGKIYVNVSIWINDKEDMYGNKASIQLQTKDEFRDEKLNRYIANLKEAERSFNEASTNDFEDFEDFAGSTTTDEDDDLPF